ncbi:hypothetical protein H8B02_12715 [Bradyrhizobium sp. Pear77]|uniref:metallophosphatase family protein n=1 Tax=Bradyrhizobium altum TaxID=1571202 RepID=UPI001E2BA015|nr:metallophosphatase family protein [Bradyrhizobium altum]MCC8954284.1 hypothetical protein [Bradyrhizobium altum]
MARFLHSPYRHLLNRLSSIPSFDAVNNVLYINPGSAGPRRFKLPTLDVTSDGLRPVIHELAAR